MNILSIDLFGLLVEFFCFNNIFWLSFNFILFFVVDIVKLKLMDNGRVILTFIQKGLFVKLEKFVIRNLGVYYKIKGL